jgi:hypothetical protein
MSSEILQKFAWGPFAPSPPPPEPPLGRGPNEKD